MNHNPYSRGAPKRRLEELEAENARLRAQLAELQPKPLTVFESNIWLDAYGESVHETEGVVRVQTIATASSPEGVTYSVSAKVKNDKGEFV